jgi:hypothetical protein
MGWGFFCMAEARRDGNRVPVIQGVSTVDFSTPIDIAVDPVTHELQTNAGSGGGGIQYELGAVSASPTGTAVAWWKDGTSEMTIASTTDPLPVAATLDTTGLALETKQDDIITALNAIDTTTQSLLLDATYADTIGEVQANPTANTVLDRLKTIATEVDTVNTTLQAGIDSNVSGSVSITDGSTTASMLSVGTGQNAQIMAGTYKEVTGLSAGLLNADLVASMDVGNYKWFCLHVEGTFTGTLTIQCSNDNTNWKSTAVQATNNTSNQFGTTVTGTGMHVGPLYGFKYFRIRMTAYTSGTATAVLTLSANPSVWSAIAAVPSGNSNVIGNVAHDAVDSSNPIKVGYKATASLSGLTLVAAADRTDAFAGLDGVPFVRLNTNLEDIVTGNASNTDGTSTQVIAASGAGIKTYLTDVTLTNTSASNIYVEIKDGSTTKWTVPVSANSGATLHFTTPLPGTANTAWNFDPSAATTTVYCSAAGFKSKI